MTRNTSERKTEGTKKRRNCRAGERGVTVGEAKNIREERQRRRKGNRNNTVGKERLGTVGR